MEIFDSLSIWFPEDEVIVKYRQSKNSNYVSIKTASAGQKTAAMLSFLLSHGNEPLLLDQPEDDLDNALITDLVVNQLRKNKLRRQLIIITHNANIVVNGNAELVISMNFAGGNIQKFETGGIQETGVRNAVCNIMEGGKEAFKQRYKYILEDLI